MILTTGCTHVALERRTVKQASTMTDLQYHQVVDNLAMFACNPHAMPWHAKVSGGVVSVTDEGNAGFEAELASGISNEVKNLFKPAVGAQRGILAQWSVEPATDPDDLELLAVAYRKAVDPANPDVDKEILDKICEVSVRFDLLPKEETIKKILGTEAGPMTGPLTEKQQKAQETLIKLLEGLDLKARENIRRAEVLKDIIDNIKLQKLVDYARLAELSRERDERLRDAGFALDQMIYLKEFLVENDTALKDKKLEERRSNIPVTINDLNDKLNLRIYRVFGIEGQKRNKNEAVQNAPRKQASPRGTEGRSSRGPQGESDTMLRLLTAIHNTCATGSLPDTDLKWETGRGYIVIDQAEDKIRKLEELLEPQFQTPWLYRGCKKDVPKCACYAGHYRGCGGDCYVWVMPEQAKILKDFTLIILTLAPIERPEFPQFPVLSPTLAR